MLTEPYFGMMKRPLETDLHLPRVDLTFFVPFMHEYLELKTVCLKKSLEIVAFYQFSQAYFCTQRKPISKDNKM